MHMKAGEQVAGYKKDARASEGRRWWTVYTLGGYRLHLYFPKAKDWSDRELWYPTREEAEARADQHMGELLMRPVRRFFNEQKMGVSIMECEK